VGRHEFHMNSIGETLKRERLKLGFDLEKISQDTKIATRLLQAVEADQLDKLPGGVFTKNFVRQYARAVGLDEDEIGNELDRLLGKQQELLDALEAERTARIALPYIPHWDRLGDRFRSSASSLPSLFQVVLVVLACSGVYIIWQQGRRPASLDMIQPIASTPVADRQPQPKPAEPAPSQVASGAPAIQRATLQGGDAASRGVDSADRALQQLSPGLVQVTLTAGEETWISVSADGKQVFAGTLMPNQTKTLAGSARIRLLVGNAGGLEVSLNGKPVGALGSRGQVRVVNLTPVGFQIAPPRPPILDDSL
jgi:cytoskeleton protein RodZ